MGARLRQRERPSSRDRDGRNRRPRSLAVVAIVAATLTIAGSASQVLAVVPGGTNIIHVPMSWCIVAGSQAAVSPNITSEGTTVADTNTDAVIWRRHERPTDNVFLPQASISLRSSINNAWGSLNFPIIADPNTTLGQQGDINSSTAEGTDMFNSCEASWAAAPLSRPNVGITAINVRLWHDAAGNYANNGRFQLGLGGCSGNPCNADYFIIVTDNSYLYPTVPNRMIPGLAGTPWADPFDLAVGHETGHALGLPHRMVTTALMNPSNWDNTGDQRVDNVALNSSEVATLRAIAQNVPGREIDPPAQFLPASVLTTRRHDLPRERGLSPNLDLAALALSLDTRTSRVRLDQRLWGLLPCTSPRPTGYGYLADLDNDPRTGATAATLSGLGLPSRMRGTDLVVRATVVGSRRKGRDFRTCQTRARAWAVRDGRLLALAAEAIDARIATMRMYKVFSRGPRKAQAPPRPLFSDVFNTIQLFVDNSALSTAVRPNRPVRMSALVLSQGSVRDRIGTGTRGARFVLQQPDFPHCFPAGGAKRGGRVAVRFDGLRPNREVHALLGPIEVLRGVQTNSQGAGRIQLPIPEGTRRGNHLVTIGHDGLALTADCTVAVQ